MRIALVTPTTWPYVRRGGERFINELAVFLGGRGHDVTIISGKAGRGETIVSPTHRTVYHRRLWHPSFALFGLLEFHAFFFRSFPSLLWGRYHITFCLTFIDTFAAILARSVTNAPCVFLVNSIPPPVQYFRSLTLNGAVIRRSISLADEVVSVSGYVRSYVERKFERQSTQLPVPVDMDQFPLAVRRDSPDRVILCVSALDDQRKGGRVLMRAFDLLKRRCPAARLEIPFSVPSKVRDELLSLVSPEVRSDVIFGDNSASSLPALYGRAAVTVLPSLWEAFGMVVIESMATGTPVVGTRDGALPELISNSAVGRLFDPGEDSRVEPSNAEGLSQALEECLDLSARPETAALCRAHAAQYAWEIQGPRFEALFERLIRERKGRGGQS